MRRREGEKRPEVRRSPRARHFGPSCLKCDAARLMRRVALLSTTLTLASAARGLRALPRPLALAHVNRLASSGARAPSAVVLAAQRGGGDDSARTSPSPPPAPPRRELDIRGYAIPLVNDVVRYPSKWAGEYLLGAVDYVQALPEDRGYVIDVRPLRAVGGERWEAKRGSKLVQENSARLRVVKEATYNVQADAWTVPENVTTALFTAVKPRPADPTRVTSGLLEYDALKWRLVREVRTRATERAPFSPHARARATRTRPA